MPTEVDKHGNIIITGQEDIARARMISIKHALRLEVKTGMTRRGRSILQIAREAACEEFSTKKQALAWFECHYPNPKG